MSFKHFPARPWLLLLLPGQYIHTNLMLRSAGLTTRMCVATVEGNSTVADCLCNTPMLQSLSLSLSHHRNTQNLHIANNITLIIRNLYIPSKVMICSFLSILLTANTKSNVKTPHTAGVNKRYFQLFNQTLDAQLIVATCYSSQPLFKVWKY